VARKASIEKNNRKKALGQKYMAFRKKLRDSAVDQTLTDEERALARHKLQALPRNTSIHRATVRCELTGRARGNYKKFGLSRMMFRKLALDGKLPGVTKASW
jgi:small subunit ribosomal protein S14